MMKFNKIKLLSKKSNRNNKLFNENVNIKRLPTRQTLVKDKQGAYMRNQHVQTEVKPVKGMANSNNTGSRRSEKYDFEEKDIKKSVGVKCSSITDGITKLQVNGTTFYAKPVRGEKFAGKSESGKLMMMRESVTLNDRETGRPLPDVHSHQILTGQEKGEIFKGTMADREVMSSRLADELGFDHFPPAEKKTLAGMETVVTQAVHTLYKDKYKSIHNDMECMMPRDGKLGETIMNIIKKDPKLSDKVMFDNLIGNMDRHEGNMFVGITKGGVPEMIGIDQGMSFPNNNKTLMEVDFGNQREFKSLMDINKITPEFKERLNNLRNSDKYEAYKQAVTDNIGEAESKAFHARVEGIIKIMNKPK